MKQKSSLDIAKFLCAILVLIIHTDPFGSYSKALSFGFRNVICVVAVPFFFATSGYLLGEKLKSLQTAREQNGYMWKYLKRLGVIYLVWSAVYFPFVVVRWLRAGFGVGSVLEYIKDFFFEGSYSTIWFLPALMSAALFYWLLRKKLSGKGVFFVGCGCYVLTLLLSSYYGITARIPVLSQLGKAYYWFFDSVKNGLLFGLVFLSLGAMISEENTLQQMKRGRSLVGIIVSAFLICAEVVVYKVIGNTRGIDTIASLLPFTFFALIFVLNIQIQPSRLCVSLRKYSMLIFLCQRIPISVIDLFMNETILATNTIVNCVVVTAASFAISFLILQLSKVFKWLNKIY